MINIFLPLLLFSAFVITIWPVIRKQRLIFPEDIANESIPLKERKRSVYKTLGEIEFDYKMNKLNDKDYKKLSNLYRQKAVLLLKEEKAKTSDIDEEIESKLNRLQEGETL